MAGTYPQGAHRVCVEASAPHSEVLCEHGIWGVMVRAWRPVRTLSVHELHRGGSPIAPTLVWSPALLRQLPRLRQPAVVLLRAGRAVMLWGAREGRWLGVAALAGSAV